RRGGDARHESKRWRTWSGKAARRRSKGGTRTGRHRVGRQRAERGVSKVDGDENTICHTEIGYDARRPAFVAKKRQWQKAQLDKLGRITRGSTTNQACVRRTSHWNRNHSGRRSSSDRP